MMNTKTIFKKKNIVQFKLSKHSLSIDFNDELSLMLSDSLVLYRNNNLIANWHFKEKSTNLEELINLVELPIDSVMFDEKSGMTIFLGDYKIEISKPEDDYEYLHVMSNEEGIYIY